MPQNSVRVWLGTRIEQLRRRARQDVYMIVLNLIYLREYDMPYPALQMLRSFEAAIAVDSRSEDSRALAAAILTFTGFGDEVRALREAERDVELVYLAYAMHLDIRAQRIEAQHERPPAYARAPEFGTTPELV